MMVLETPSLLTTLTEVSNFPNLLGESRFEDEDANCCAEYSRDIEPQDSTQAGGHGSKYLDWTKQYISAYKADQGLPGGLTGY